MGHYKTLVECLLEDENGYANYIDVSLTGVLADVDDVSVGLEASRKLWKCRSNCSAEYFDA